MDRLIKILILIIVIILVFSVAITFVVPVQSSTSSNLSKLMIAGNQFSEAGTLIDEGTIVQGDPTGETNKKFITTWKTYKYNPNYLKVFVTETDETVSNVPTKFSFAFILKKTSKTKLAEIQQGNIQYFTTNLTAEQYYPTWVQEKFYYHD